MSRLTRSSAKLASALNSPASTPTASRSAPKSVNAPTSPPTLHFKDSTAFETWLESNHTNAIPGIWLKISKKASGIPSVTYDEAVSAALCYGWIDGQRKALDATHFTQRFTPRRKGSIWSKRNVDRVAQLEGEGRMRDAGRKEVEAAKGDGRWERAYAGSRDIEVTPEFQAALDENAEARDFFETLSKSQRYGFLFRIATAKRADTRERKIRQFVELLARKQTL